MKTGLDNSESAEMKNLKSGDILFSAEFRSPENEVVAVPYIFKEYVKSPDKANPDSIWARLIEASFDENNVVQPLKIKRRDGELREKSIVNDVSCGLYKNYEDCLKEFIKMFDEMKTAAENELQRVYAENPYDELTIGEGIEIETNFSAGAEAIAETQGENEK